VRVTEDIKARFGWNFSLLGWVGEEGKSLSAEARIELLKVLFCLVREVFPCSTECRRMSVWYSRYFSCRL